MHWAHGIHSVDNVHQNNMDIKGGKKKDSTINRSKP